MTTELISQLIADAEKMQKEVQALLNSTQVLIQENDKIKKEIQEILGDRAKHLFVNINAEIQIQSTKNPSISKQLGENIDQVKRFISDEVEFNTVMNDVRNLIK